MENAAKPCCPLSCLGQSPEAPFAMPRRAFDCKLPTPCRNPVPSPAARASDGAQRLGGTPAATPSTLWPSTPSPTMEVACAADLSFQPPCWMALPCEDGVWEAMFTACFQPLPVPPSACPVDRGPRQQAVPTAGVVSDHGAAPWAVPAQDAAVLSAAEDTDAARGGRPAPSHSLGSAGHSTGECKPCAWYYKPQGCSMGDGCDFCHLCDASEIKIRKKAKAASLRQGSRR